MTTVRKNSAGNRRGRGTLGAATSGPPPEGHPNILIILTDQQSASVMSCAGDQYVRTPAMDSLAAEGTRFERAYCTNPICAPSRFSLFTGRMPSEIGQRENSARDLPPIPDHIASQGMGWLFRQAGYDVPYAGKQHFPKLTAEGLGFDLVCEDERDGVADFCAEFLRTPRDRPFLLVASFINPHDICHMAIREHPVTDFDRLILRKCVRECEMVDWALQRPPGVAEQTFWEELCPPLPPNFEPQANEPEAIGAMLASRPFRQFVRENWSDQQWRLHRWAYRRLTERVDHQIGHVLDALRTGPNNQDTLIVFTSDHGDHDGAHRLEHKSTLYEEAVNVPLIMRVPNGPTGRVDSEHLVSNGLDLLPTLCDASGIALPAGLAGRSLLSLARPQLDCSWREALPIEGPTGLAVVTERHKYVRHDTGRSCEQLYDRSLDPGEMRNAFHDAQHADLVPRLRAMHEAFHGQEPIRHGRPRMR